MIPDYTPDLTPDETLIEQARHGNREAYNELLARHRGRAFAWAKQITPDHHLAEDIVQEALIRAFLKLGTMTDLSKFLPWLRTIVRNQAMMKLRRGGPHAHERPFTALGAAGAHTSGDNEPDWRDLDTVLHHYAKRKGEAGGAVPPHTGEEVPLAEWLPAVIKALGPKEREVFVKHFYEQLSPQEIADYWDTNVNTIHKALSRIRRKAEDIRIELDIRSRIRAHSDTRGGGRKVVLTKPGIREEPPVHPGAAFPNAIYHILRSMGRPVTLAEVTGFSGYAFVLNVRRSTIGAESPMIWDWDTFISNGLLNLGYHSRYVDYQHYKNAGSSPHKTRNFLYTLDMIRESIDKGVPAIVSSAISYELALVYGYDDEKQVLYAVDPQACEEIPYSSLYTGSPKIDKAISRELYAFVLDGELDEKRRRPDHRLLRLLQRVTRHAEGNDPTFMPCTGGLPAYDEWIAAFEKGTVDPFGNASNVHLYGWFREQSVLFWSERIEYECGESGEQSNVIKEIMQQVKRCYEAVGESFGKLRELFPFPHGGAPHDPAFRLQAVRLLRQAKADEESGIAHIRALATTLLGEAGANRSAPVNHITLNPFYSFGGNRPKPVPDTLAIGSLDAVVCMCGSLKESMTFYSRLLGIDAAPERLDGPVGFLPLREDKLLVLMDRRLDLNHADWRPAFYIRVPDVDLAYKNAKEQGWTIVNFLDKGGLFTDFFIAADPDGHQLIIGSHPLSQAFPLAGSASEGHPLVCAAGPLALAVKDPIASVRAYGNLFGPELAGQSLRFLDKYSSDAAVRLRFEAADGEQAYRLIRNKEIAASRTTEDSDAGLREWLVRDPDDRPIAIRLIQQQL
ncbi:sigma-70 family RNA polymerase sigma factor [Paenibacillus mesophilus]|uniref:sigma-70 family RNA polymerase sigma factor n=1 Tax=Paenibacillus mesophilus TaxID=2582849 RepID=UPI00110E5903|nr:sigma-70 family RNA polymerase sigma factor [Paenibacillus mesophilus]TMV46974.1 sigma-70 family RNA polymerase sigma factor [Paenibacillus mesophilus]